MLYVSLKAIFEFVCVCVCVCSRLVGEGVKALYEHTQGSSAMRLNSEISFSQMELLECLFSTETPEAVKKRGCVVS